MENFYFEVTDTFGADGEANYAWVSRFKTQANSRQEAIERVTDHTGYVFPDDTGPYSFGSTFDCLNANVVMFDLQCMTDLSDNKMEEIYDFITI
jgi:hypothetical protein